MVSISLRSVRVVILFSHVIDAFFSLARKHYGEGYMG